MRRYLLALAFTISTAISLSASAQVTDQLEIWHPCGAGPASNEVFIYDAINYGGRCSGLYVGLFPYANTSAQPGSFGLANDSLKSLKVGSGVRARLFVDGIYGGNHFYFGGPGNYPDISVYGWSNVASSLRVEVNSRSITCNDLQIGEFAVFRDANYGEDCMVLHYGKTYSTPDTMGIANDSISSVLGGPFEFCGQLSTMVILWENVNEGGNSVGIGSGTNAASLPIFNDATSSISTICH
ncbi:MAG TPA: hypothetical protein VGP64_03640 [Polyangia bacterium]|jgi:hypothetical protein